MNYTTLVLRIAVNFSPLCKSRLNSLKTDLPVMNTLVRSFCTARFCKQVLPEELHQLVAIDLDKLEENVMLRQHNNNVPQIRKLLSSIRPDNAQDIKTLKSELFKLPNSTHPRLHDYGTEPKQVELFVPKGFRNTRATEFSEASKYMNLFRMDHLGNYTGHKSYYLFGKIAEMEHALKEYAVDMLCENDFSFLSVPDILPKSIIEGCGMQADGERTQVYKLDSGLCLSGTSEMALAGFYENKVLEESELPIKVAAVSRCYRAETSGLTEEKGIYRVHQFTKVEMFSICTETQSENMLENFKNLQLDIFKKMGLKIRLLDMPPVELGAPAYQKYDIETWMPGRETWGEISSCSNCTDYQSKRLNIRYRTKNGDIKNTHTVNGTAAAIPRLLIGILETNQIDSNIIQVPEVISNFMSGNTISRDKYIPEIKLLKHLKQTL
ncbi:seryl-tRNA synthetase, mitochondrial [Musca autumnalis]|uniref:seryl-tRNA synthetase, mitochondrial n=1 Tax=Musca autumnalis TaxID=221902 RepID=UPI003CF47CF1